MNHTCLPTKNHEPYVCILIRITRAFEHGIRTRGWTAECTECDWTATTDTAELAGDYGSVHAQMSHQERNNGAAA